MVQLVIVGAAIRSRAANPPTPADLTLVMNAPVEALRARPTFLTLVAGNPASVTVPVQVEVFTSSPGVSVGTAPSGCRLFSSPPTIGFDCDFQLAPGSREVRVPWTPAQQGMVHWQASVFTTSTLFLDPNQANNFDSVDTRIVVPEELLKAWNMVADFGDDPTAPQQLTATSSVNRIPIAPYRVTATASGSFRELDLTMRLDSNPKGIATYQGITPSQGCTLAPLLIHCIVVRPLANPPTTTYIADVGVTGEGTALHQFQISVDDRPPVFGAAEIAIMNTPPANVPYALILDAPSVAQGPYAGELNIYLNPPHTSIMGSGSLTTMPAGGAVYGPVMTTPPGTVTMPSPTAFLFSFDAPTASTATQTAVVFEADPQKAGVNNNGIVVSIDGGPRLSLTTATVVTMPTFTSVNASPNTAVRGQPVTFTAGVTTPAVGSGNPTGTITFLDGATVLSTKPVSATGQASLTTSALAVGTHTITARYGGTSSFGASTGTVTEIITRAPSTLTFVSTPNPAVAGRPVTFTVTANVPAPGVGIPTGVVTFLDGATLLGTVPLNAARQAILTTGALAIGSHTITASYEGNATVAASTAMLTETITKASTTTTLVSGANPAVTGRPVTFTATVKAVAPGAGIPTGPVTFMDGATVLGTGTLNGSGQATLTTATLPVGPHSITASYGADTNFLASNSTALTETIAKAATAVLLTATSAQTVLGQPVTFTAKVNVVAPGVGLPSGTVTFFNGTVSLGPATLDNTGQASLTTSSLTLGPHAITAKYGGDGSFNGSTSPVLTETITKVLTTTAVLASVNPAVNGQSVLFTAQVSVVPPLTGTPTGTITFLNGTAVLGTATVDNAGQASLTASTLTVGPHAITARYNGDATFAGSVSPVLTETINKADTTTTVTGSLSPSIRGQKVTFTATVGVVAPGTGLPTGLVTFKDGATTLGTGMLNAARQAALTTSAVAVGARSITASYAGNAIVAPSVSPPLPQTVNTASSKTTLLAPVATAPIGRPLTFTATVDVLAPGAAVPTGTVTFIVDGLTALGTATLNAARQATLTTGALSVGDHSITATYGGNADIDQSLSAAVNETITPSATTTTLTSSANPSVTGRLVTLSALVNAVAPSLGLPPGNVTFLDGLTALGTVNLNGSHVATLTTGALSVGPHLITATYGGEGGYLSSSSLVLKETVNKAATTTALATSITPAILAQSVTFTATVGAAAPGAGTPTGTLTFLDGATVLGTATLDGGGHASLTRSDLTLGVHAITARYGGDAGFLASASAPKVETITKVQTSTLVVSSLDPVVHGQAVTFTASVAVVPPGGGTPTGTLTFLDGAVVLGTAPLDSGGHAGLTTSTLTTGPHAITARYGGDATFSGSLSTALTQTINKAATTTTVTSSANPAVHGQAVTFTATVDVVAPGTGAPTGVVTFKNGAATLGPGTLNAARQATLKVTNLTTGDHSITASYAGNTVTDVSTSAPLTETITQADKTPAPRASGTP